MALTNSDLNKIKKITGDATVAALAQFYDLALKPEIDRLESRIINIESRIINIEKRLDKIDDRLYKLESEVKDIKTHLSEQRDAPQFKEYRKLELRIARVEHELALA